MMKRAILQAAIILLSVVDAGRASAETPVTGGATLPITIRWEQVQPSDVSIVGESGTELMTYNAATQSFSGVLQISGDLKTQRTVLLKYDGNSFPLILNVRRAMAPIRFTVSRDTFPSCANPYVYRVEQAANNMDDAMRRLLNAAHMLEILPANNCTGSRLARATRAQLERNDNLAVYSGGLFSISPGIRQAYIDSVGINPGDRRDAVALADASQLRADSAFAGRAYADMKLAVRNGEPNAALALGSSIAAAIDADPDIANAFADQGISAERIDADTSFFQALAAQPR